MICPQASTSFAAHPKLSVSNLPSLSLIPKPRPQHDKGVQTEQVHPLPLQPPDLFYYDDYMDPLAAQREAERVADVNRTLALIDRALGR